MQAIWKVAWERLTLITQSVGEVNSRIILTLIYFTVFVPFGLISRFGTDPLDFKGEPSWLTRKPVAHDIKSAKLQG